MKNAYVPLSHFSCGTVDMRIGHGRGRSCYKDGQVDGVHGSREVTSLSRNAHG
jgi:hypothetical protein